MIKKILLICTLLSFFAVNANSRENIDALINKLDTAKSYAKVDILNHIAELMLSESVVGSFEYSSKAFKEGLQNNYTAGWGKAINQLTYGYAHLNISQKISESIEGLFETYIHTLSNDDYNKNIAKMHYGTYLAYHGKWFLAINHLLESSFYFNEIKDSTKLIQIYRKLGWIYFQIKDESFAAENAEKAADISLALNQYDEYIESMLLISVWLLDTQQIERTKEIAEKILINSIKDNNKYGEAVYHRLLGLAAIRESKLDEARRHFDKSIEDYKAINHNQGLADVYTLRGHCDWIEQDYFSSLKFNKLSYEFRLKLGADNYAVSSLINMGYDYLKLDSNAVALQLAEKAITISLGSTNTVNVVRSYQLAYKAAYELGKVDLALKYLENKDKYDVIVLQSQRNPDLIKAQLKYNLKKTEAEFTEIALDKEKSKNLYITVIFILIILFAAIIIIRYVQKNFDNRVLTEKNLMLENAYLTISEKEKELLKINEELDELVKSRTRHLSAEIQQRTMAEANLMQLKDNLELAYSKERELNELKSRFINVISHEFGTPLTVISSSADILKMINNEQNTPFIEKQTNKIKNSVKQITTMIEEVTNFSKTGNSDFKPELSEFKLNDMIDEVTAEQLITYKSIANINTSFNELPCIVKSDKKLLKHILSNIVGNAVKYNINNKDIDIKVIKKNHHLQVEVSDFGIGIPASEIDKIWLPFMRANNVETISGTGFGLYIVKDFVNKLNGDIRVTSEIGKGTKVHLKIPA